jgi:hypothetical protein
MYLFEEQISHTRTHILKNIMARNGGFFLSQQHTTIQLDVNVHLMLMGSLLMNPWALL